MLPLLAHPSQVNLSTFSYLFSELIQYCQARVSNIGELERRSVDPVKDAHADPIVVGRRHAREMSRALSGRRATSWQRTDPSTPCPNMHRLDTVGFGVGVRLLELLSYRERNSRRDLKLLDALRFVHTTLWRYLFGRPAKDLEQSNNVRAGVCM